MWENSLDNVDDDELVAAPAVSHRPTVFHAGVTVAHD